MQHDAFIGSRFWAGVDDDFTNLRKLDGIIQEIDEYLPEAA